MRPAILSLLLACSSPVDDSDDAAHPPHPTDALASRPCTLPTELEWTLAAPAPIGREEAQAIAVGHKLYIVGGYDEGYVFTWVESYAYDIDADSWTRLADAPDKITHAGHESDGSRIYLVGALLGDGLGPSTTKSWVYEIVQDSWTTGPPLPAPRGAGGLARLGHSLHYFGRGIRSVPERPIEVDTAEHWTLDLDQPGAEWQPAAPLPNPRNHLGATVINGQAYAIGGQHLQDE